MSRETSVEELSKKRAYKLSIGGYEIVAMKLEGYKALQVAGTLSPIAVGVKGAKVEGDDWLVIVKDPKGIVQPIETWAKQVSVQIKEVSGGAMVNTVSVLNPSLPYETLRVESEEDLARALEEGWTEPYQYISGKWILRRPRHDMSIAR